MRIFFEAGALSAKFLDEVCLEYAEKKSGTEQEREKAFLENTVVLSEEYGRMKKRMRSLMTWMTCLVRMWQR